MSLYGALFSGVSGLSAQSSAMSAIGDNVTNINTVGYKETDVNFNTLVTAQTSNTQYSSGGVQSAPRAGISVQGLLQSTTTATDVAISGNGFFPVSANAENPSGFAYTRAGSFVPNQQGYLENTAGYFMQGWPLENWDGTATASTTTVNGNTYMRAYQTSTGQTYYINSNATDSTNLQPLNLSTISGTAQATSTLQVGANLPSSDSVGATEQTSLLIYDSLGNSHNMNLTWLKQGQNEWGVSMQPPAGATYVALKDQSSAHATYYAAGRVDLTGIPASGSSMTLTQNGVPYTFNFTTSATSPSINVAQPGGNDDLDFSGATPTNGDTITVGTQTFTFTTNPTGASNEIDISSGNASTIVASTVSAINSTFTSLYGAGTYAETDPNNSTQVLLSIPATASTGTSPPGLTTSSYTANTFTINTTGQSLAQIVDQLGSQMNTMMVTKDGGAPLGNPSLTYAGAVSGADAVTLSQDSSSEPWTVDASNMLLSNGNPAVTQNKVYTIPAVNSASNWLAAASSSNAGYAITFNGDGSPKSFFGYDASSANDPHSEIAIGWANGALNMDGSDVTSGGSPTISTFLGNYNTSDGITQLAGSYNLNYLQQNGDKFGNFSGVSIGTDGIVTATFDNGVTRPIFQIPIATFVNPDGLQSLSGNVYQETDASGLPTVRVAGTSGAGAVQGSSLEASTVDLGQQFTTMITTQQAYSAASKVITTADQMLTTLLSIKQ